MITSYRNCLLATVAGLTVLPSVSFADGDFTCWAPASNVLAQAGPDYWTEERLRNAVPETPGVPADGPHLGGTSRLGDAERAPIDTAPYKFGGKLFFTRGGVDYTASAQFVAGDKIVIAAAHSLWKGGATATNIRFIQGYNGGGGTPYQIDLAAVLTAWTGVADNPPSLSRSQYDYSVMRTTEPTAVGRYDLGVVGLDATVTVTGYPGRIEGGEYMYREEGTIVLKAGDAYQSMPHPMYGGGASGGAWFVGESEPYQAVSVVSSGNETSVYGPAFTQKTQEMIDYVSGGCK